MNFVWLTARRLGLVSGSSRTGISVAVTAVALAVVVLELTLAVVTGFKNEIERKLSGFESQVSVLAPFANNGAQEAFFSTQGALVPLIESVVPSGATVTEGWRQPGILKTETDFEGVMFEAIAPEAPCAFQRSNIISGTWPDFRADSCSNLIVLSEALANRLGLRVGDRLYSTFIVNEDVKIRRNTIAALYRSDFGEYDLKVVYCPMKLLQSVNAAGPESAERIVINGLAEKDIDNIGSALQTTLLNAAATGTLEQYHPVSTVHQTGAMYYNWLSLLDTNVVVIFVLMIAVTGLTLVSGLFILALERIGTIGILRALGSSRAQVKRIFILLTLRVVGIGLIIGNVVGIGFILVQKYWHIVPLNPEMYYLNSVPVEFNILELALLNVGVVVCAYLILVVPAWLAAGVSPARAMRYD